MSDPWGTSSGLIDEYSGTVVESWFGINPQYNESLHLLFWKIEVDNPEEFPQLTDTTIQEQFSIGEVWESLDGGETVEYAGKPDKKFNSNSQYGTIINRALGEWNLRDELMKKGPDPQHAEIWIGLRFHFKAETLGKPFTGRDGQEVIPKPKVMPVAYLGEGEVSEATRPDYDLAALGLTTDQETELGKVASAADSFGDFLDKAMKLTWVSENASVVGALADQTLWQSLRPF